MCVCACVCVVCVCVRACVRVFRAWEGRWWVRVCVSVYTGRGKGDGGCMFVRACVSVSVCVRACVCVRERDRQRRVPFQLLR